jgi:predicted transcriptional regulator
MVTTIQITEELKEKLSFRKMTSKDSYEDVIWDLLEDTLELNEQTIKEIENSRKEFEKGHFISHSKLKKELGL